MVAVGVDATSVQEDRRALRTCEAEPRAATTLAPFSGQESRRSFHVILPLHSGVQAGIYWFSPLRFRGEHSLAEVKEELQELDSPIPGRLLDSDEFLR